MLFRFQACLVVLAAMLICNPVDADDSADEVDEKLLEKLQGEWDPVSSIFDGKEKEINREQKPSIAIEGRSMSIRFQDRVVGKFEIKHLITNESLGHIDYEMREPRHETVRVKQLFKLDGEKLTTCVVSPPGGDRPSELASTAGSKRILTVSERRKTGKGTVLKPFLAKPSSVILDETFSGQKLGQQWVVNKGSWSIHDSVVIGREKKEDMHAAVLTLQQPHRNSIIQFSFRLDGATGFNLSLNHAKGHLFRVGVNPTGISVTKDKDKKDPNSKVVVLGKADGKFASGQWYTMLLETFGDQVGVQTDNGLKLEAREPSLEVDKTGYRFVIRGESLLLDDVQVWKTEPK